MDADPPTEFPKPPVLVAEVHRTDDGFEVCVTSGGAQSQDWTELRDAYVAARDFFADQIAKQGECPFKPGAEGEELANAKELFRQFRASAPSAPDWYHLIDHCMTVLFSKYITRLEQDSAKAPSP